MPSVSTTARLYSDNTGSHEEVRVLLTPEGPLLSLLEYSLTRAKSASWNRKLLRGVSLFLDYLEACPGEKQEWRLFRNFATALRYGTFNSSTGLDPSGLCWLPFSQDAEFYIRLLSDYFDWLADKHPRAAKLNPSVPAYAHEARLQENAYLLRRSKALLGHGWRATLDSPTQRTTLPLRPPKIAPQNPPTFPDAHFESLLFNGFKVGGRYDFRGMLITLLIHGAGFRLSETFHLYMCDVQPDESNPNAAEVRIHHPVYGKSPIQDHISGDSRLCNRAKYLASEWSLRPRNQLIGSLSAGWKGSMLDGAFHMRAWWFYPDFGELFLQLWKEYINRVSSIDRDNPFAFVNTEREPIGSIYTISSFYKAYYSAAERAGLPTGKVNGVSPHGHRHAYMQRLRRAGIGEMERQRFIHHKSIESQRIYSQPSQDEISAALADAANKLRNQSSQK